ncbi:MAG: hypothetical protein NC089_12085 [Bacteroides sp.]|nr:hypothetical protein [Bacteroides sp.]MCM1550633.1 nucleoside recognition protein [Clostridium sp.]
MLNYIWAFMIIIGIIVAAFTGTMEPVSSGILDSSKEAISLCIVMLGVVGMWTGVMKIAEETGLVRQLTKLLMPVLRLLFPQAAEEEQVIGYIAANMIANLLGLGWASTPTGLKAIKGLHEIHKKRCEESGENPDAASDEMCLFMVINISSLQLIPINMIAYRSQYGSVHPGAIILPGLAATFASTLVGILYGLWKCRRNTHENKKG